MTKGKASGREESDNDSTESLLYETITELRALAYLFETQGPKVNEIVEFEMDEISYGLGRLLRQQVERLDQLREVLGQR